MRITVLTFTREDVNSLRGAAQKITDTDGPDAPYVADLGAMAMEVESVLNDLNIPEVRVQIAVY